MIDFDNTTENRETLAELIVSYWDMKDLVLFAQGQLMDAWDASVVGEDAADESWSHDVGAYKDQLEDLCEKSVDSQQPTG
tara:strand:+ start:817 stop:1056 length:240 start_codon:yes stop_codon:yes gene_type:complete